MMRLGWASLAGLVGGLVFLVVIWDAILGGVFRMSYLEVLGSSLAHGVPRHTAYAVGGLAHIVLSAGFGVAYAWVLERAGVSSVAAGASIGLVIGSVHGLAASRIGRRYGTSTLTVWLLAHAVFGVTVGAVYTAVAH
jgi:hypothetical protein